MRSLLINSVAVVPCVLSPAPPLEAVFTAVEIFDLRQRGSATATIATVADTQRFTVGARVLRVYISVE